MPTVQLFITCLVDSFFPEVGEAMVSVLRRAGVDVDFRAIKPAVDNRRSTPDCERGRDPSRNTPSEKFEAVKGDIVIPSGSCAHNDSSQLRRIIQR